MSYSLAPIIPLDGCLSFVALRFQRVRCGKFLSRCGSKRRAPECKFARFPGRGTTGGTTHDTTVTSRPRLQFCRICWEAVELEAIKTDENGQANHAECFDRQLSARARSGRSRAEWLRSGSCETETTRRLPARPAFDLSGSPDALECVKVRAGMTGTAHPPAACTNCQGTVVIAEQESISDIVMFDVER